MTALRTPDDISAHLAHLTLRQLSAGTIYQRRRHLIRLHRYLMSERGVSDLLHAEHDDIEAWWGQLRIGPQASVTALAHVAEFYKWAARQDYIVGDPTRFIIRPKLRAGLPRPISEQDLQLALDTAPPRIRLWLILAAWCGLRAMEIAGLHRDEVLDSADPAVIIVHGKGGRERIVPIGPAVLLEMQAYGMPSRGHIFSRRDGRPGPNQPWMVSHLANAHLHSIGISATIHQLRHRYGTQIHGITKDLRVTQELLGHASPSTTAGYAAYSKASAVAAARRLDQTLVSPNGQTTLPIDLGQLTARPTGRRGRIS